LADDENGLKTLQNREMKIKEEEEEKEGEEEKRRRRRRRRRKRKRGRRRGDREPCGPPRIRPSSD